ncbi:3681_t:CDS:2, partial [Ambispora leptoticha]
MSQPAETTFSLHSPRMKSCCCCFKLKTGVVIISILWLFYGLYRAITDLIAFQNRDKHTNNFFSHVYTYTIIEGILSLFIAIGALYGLFIVSFANKRRQLQNYVTIAWIIVVLQSFLKIANIVIVIAFKNSYMKYCKDQDYDEDTCMSSYNILLSVEIVQDLLAIIISIYFATVIAAYRTHRFEKETTAGVAE